MWLSPVSNSLLGTTVKTPDKFPVRLVTDEKITWLNDAESCLYGTGS